MSRDKDARPGKRAVRDALATRRAELLRAVRRRARASMGAAGAIFAIEAIDEEDVVQTAAQRALERADQVRDPARAEAWVGRVVQNALRDELRKPRRAIVPVDEVPIASEADGEALDAGETCWCVLAQAKRLKPEYAAILQRVVIDGVPIGECAAELGLTTNNATVRLHRARAALRKQLQSHCGTTRARACSECGCEERGCCPRP